MRLIKLFWRNERGTLVADLAKAGAAIAFLSVIAANVIRPRAPGPGRRSGVGRAGGGPDDDGLAAQGGRRDEARPLRPAALRISPARPARPA